MRQMFSAASSPKDTRVFRFYRIKKKKIDGSVLKMALIRLSRSTGLSVSHAKRTFLALS